MILALSHGIAMVAERSSAMFRIRSTMTPATTLADLLVPETDQPAMILPETGSVSRRRLAEQVEQLARTLRSWDLKPGQVVAIVLPNGLEYLASFLAVTRRA